MTAARPVSFVRSVSAASANAAQTAATSSDVGRTAAQRDSRSSVDERPDISQHQPDRGVLHGDRGGGGVGIKLTDPSDEHRPRNAAQKAQDVGIKVLGAVIPEEKPWISVR